LSYINAFEQKTTKVTKKTGGRRAGIFAGVFRLFNGDMCEVRRVLEDQLIVSDVATAVRHREQMNEGGRNEMTGNFLFVTFVAFCSN
jgi:hypothetical protein